MSELERRRFYLHKDVMDELKVYSEICGKPMSVVLEEILVEFLFPHLGCVESLEEKWENF